MIVKVKGIAVFHDGERHETGEELEIRKEDLNDFLFEIIEETSAIDQEEVGQLAESYLKRLSNEKLQALLSPEDYDENSVKAELIAKVIEKQKTEE